MNNIIILFEILTIMNTVKKASKVCKFIWQDREIKFDLTIEQLSMREGELIIGSLNNVEDTKGNNGDVGSMIITNLRIIWFCDKNRRINLSIGHNCIIGNEIKDTRSILRGG